MLIDLGTFVVCRGRLLSLQCRMEFADWSYDQLTDPQQRWFKKRLIAGILEDLTTLSQSEPDVGKLMNSGADMYPPVLADLVV